MVRFGVLFAINAMNFFDRLVIGAVGEPIRLEYGLDDKMLGLLSTAFTLVYAVVGLPFGRIADRLSRKRILSIGVFAWSLLTGLSGVAQSFWQIFTARLGVGIAEASCAPAATSLIGDLFPPEKRARAMSIFMLGLPIGIALSFAVSGAVAKQYGWRAAFLVAGIPGLILAAASLFIREPERGSSDKAGIDKTSFSGSPFRKIVASPTMRWLIISGAIHNFSLYALSFFPDTASHSIPQAGYSAGKLRRDGDQRFAYDPGPSSRRYCGRLRKALAKGRCTYRADGRGLLHPHRCSTSGSSYLPETLPGSWHCSERRSR